MFADHNPPGWAHPRACGENERIGRNDYRLAGSSPRVRGKLRAAQVGVRMSRLIPARAGKT